MAKHSLMPRVGVVLAAVSSLWLGVGGSAAAEATAPDVTVTIFADHYVVAGRTIDDLDVLEAAVSSVRPKAVRLDACGAGTARAQQAAAHRFRNMYMELRMLDAESTTCRSAVVPRAVPATLRLDQRPTGIDDAAVGQWWHELMP